MKLTPYKSTLIATLSILLMAQGTVRASLNKTQEQAKIDTAIEQVFGLLGQAKDRGYIGEPVSQLEHALQAAALAKEDCASPDTLVSALVHDIGHLCVAHDTAKMDGFGVDNHHGLGAKWLIDLGFSKNVADLVEGHVRAKRYLVSKDPTYIDHLSVASQETLKRQGGPMSPEEVQDFEAHPLFQHMLRMRFYDDQAKRIDWIVPDLDSYRPIVRAHLEQQLH